MKIRKDMNALIIAQEISESRNQETMRGTENHIFIRDTNVIRRLKLDDILFAEAMGDYVKLHTQEKLYAIHTKLKTVEERLPSCSFLRIHRSYIVALNKIDTFQGGSLQIGSRFLPVSDTYKKILNVRMNIL
ncbi:LytTr DNA-binding domain-containing protein [Pedobacter westerhofensis]|uniref:LytTr DNA-binding domain-containing protein n=1 Tax=Pedobacter westerhofensis TaxID=425512 RepID=A0A521CU03_9SPHI|nr:LytTR family DNA-binding domain-containing protein [Pedobacter westerhofensis]SMO62937.1 LytTr DNA-binding domain-containing protein [Pedobacter westerhofensis]